MKEAIEFGVYRVLGNDIPIRHGEHQTELNLGFICREEGELLDAEKIFCLNRIVSQTTLDGIRKTLDAKGYRYFEIPFVEDEYRQCRGFDEKLRYLTNLNPARNRCIEHGLNEFEIAVILDGSVFMRQEGWFGFVELVYGYPEDAVYAIPVHRAEHFDECLAADFRPQIRESYKKPNGQTIYGLREVYLAFTRDADVRFNEEMPYGKVDKVELMWRLGMAGPWDHWEPAIRKEAVKNKSLYAGSVKINGHAIRLPSHSGYNDSDNRVRGGNRIKGCRVLVKQVDEKFRKSS